IGRPSPRVARAEVERRGRHDLVGPFGAEARTWCVTPLWRGTARPRWSGPPEARVGAHLEREAGALARARGARAICAEPQVISSSSSDEDASASAPSLATPLKRRTRRASGANAELARGCAGTAAAPVRGEWRGPVPPPGPGGGARRARAICAEAE